MGLKTMGGNGSRDIRRERFGAYFPRLFAYVCSVVGDEARARETVVESFTRAFAHRSGLSESEFPIVLFGHARDLCRTEPPSRVPPVDGLSVREREVIGLLFDAKLSRDQICSLLRIRSDAVLSALIHGLRKLRTTMGPSRPAASLRFS